MSIKTPVSMLHVPLMIPPYSVSNLIWPGVIGDVE